MTTFQDAVHDKHERQLGYQQTFDRFRIAKLLLVLAVVPSLRASPISGHVYASDHPHEEPSRWLYLTTAVVLVLLGGAFAGLTIALMGQDEIYLQVIASSGEGSERAHASKVLKLIKKGKHWVLVTLLLSNVITNETLPIVLDRSLGGGWPAILSSTVLIVIFGEIAPQSICVRYGLPIGAWMAPFVLILMWLMAPVAWPVAKLLDYLLGEDHGTTYKKAGLKTLVTLHKTMGTSPDERLNQDEVTIISAVLDLKEKPVGSIMTPMNDAFTLSADTVLDEEMMDDILSAGYSRIPIHSPDNELNFVGMLLVKMLITYDPEDAMRVDDFALATLPETRPETSCLDIVNFFQEGKSHMVLVSDFPGESYGALGVVTLEDVIEELIGEEIIDESDVYVDVHKAIRRLAPAPRTRVPKGKVVPDSEHSEDTYLKGINGSVENQTKGRQTVNRASSAANVNRLNKNNASKMKEQFKNLGPSNLASKPRQTRYANFKIKPGVSPDSNARSLRQTKSYYVKRPENASPQTPQNTGSLEDRQLASAGKDASDAVKEVRQGYGTMDRPWTSERRNTDSGDTYKPTDQAEERSKDDAREENSDDNLLRPSRAERGGTSPMSLSRSPTRQRHARSGSIMEQTVNAGGIKKIVLEPNDESDQEEGEVGENHNGANGHDATDKGEGSGDSSGHKENTASKASSKKKRSSRKKKKGGKSGDESSQPLLSGKD